MVSPSKLFNEAVVGKTCAFFLHPNKTCCDMCRDLMIKTVAASFQNYFPTCVVPLIFKIKDWNKKFLYNSLIDYLRCVLAGYCLSLVSMSSFCMVYKITKKFNYSTFVFLPCLIGGSSLLLVPERIRYIQGIGLINIFIESLIKGSESKTIEALRESKLCGTVLFMIFSACTMFGFKTSSRRRFWFTSISKTLETTEKNHKICAHIGTCNEYLKKELISSGKFGLVIGLSKFLVTQYRTIMLNPKNFISILFKNIDYGMIMFMFSYGGVFKILNCILNNYYGKETSIHTLISGFLCGLTYLFYPKYAVFSFGLSSALELMWMSYIENTKNKPKLIELINKLPYNSIQVVFFIAYLFHLRVVRPDITSYFIHKMMATGTAYKTEILANSFASIIMGYK